MKSSASSWTRTSTNFASHTDRNFPTIVESCFGQSKLYKSIKNRKPKTFDHSILFSYEYVEESKKRAENCSNFMIDVNVPGCLIFSLPWPWHSSCSISWHVPQTSIWNVFTCVYHINLFLLFSIYDTESKYTIDSAFSQREMGYFKLKLIRNNIKKKKRSNRNFLFNHPF